MGLNDLYSILFGANEGINNYLKKSAILRKTKKVKTILFLMVN